MLKNALLAGLVLSWPVAFDFWVEPVLQLGEQAGGALGALYAPAEPKAARPLPPPSAEEIAVPLGEQELRDLEANPNGESSKSQPAKRPGPLPSGHGKAKQRRRADAASRTPLPPPKHGIRVSQASVLRLARAGAVPSGQFVAHSGSRPAGLRLTGVSALGIGVQDGDVLTHVSGVPVSNKGQVVNLVLQARARQATHIAGRFYRDGEPWLLLVEMPYPQVKAHRPEPKTPPPRVR
jgi:hypothetical protein